MSSARKLIRNQPAPRLGRFLWRISHGPARGLGRLLFSMKVEGRKELPPPPFVLAANHYSHLDPVVVGAAVGRVIRYLAVDELFGVWRFFDWLLGVFGVIPVSRSRVPLSTMRVALARLDAGDIVGVFPEGTRVAKWGDLPPKRGAAWLAVRANVPLLPVVVLGTDRVFGVENRLHWSRIRVVIGPSMSPSGEDATTLTSKWEEWMTGQLAADKAQY